MTTQTMEPIYNDRVHKIIHDLKMGKTREEIAKEMGHDSYKTNDMYLSRRNFKWNRTIQNYEPKKATKHSKISTSSPGKQKVRGIISHLKNGKNTREVAKLYKFENSNELGLYMKDNGFEWNTEVQNYVPIIGKLKYVELENQPAEIEQEIIPTEEISEVEKPVVSRENGSSPKEADEIIHLLVHYQDRLMEVLNVTHNSNIIPRYALPGYKKTKSLYLNNEVGEMLKEYCDERSLEQGDIVEVAIIEFMKKYGYEADVKQRLQC